MEDNLMYILQKIDENLDFSNIFQKNNIKFTKRLEKYVIKNGFG